MRRGGRSPSLVGRRREQETLAALLVDAQRGRSRTLVIRGEAGIGKSALIDDALVGAPDLRAIHISGAESEMELSYAGIHQVCAPFVELMGRLPAPQRAALHVALGLQVGEPPDQLLVGLALLTLLGEASSERATVVVIDDAQWVDAASLQALTIVARRILAEPLAVLFAIRDPHALRGLAGLPNLALTGLTPPDARALLAHVLPGLVDEAVLENIVAEAGGNPLALLELHKALTPDELAGGFGLAFAASREDRIERTYGRRLRELPADTRNLLLIAACEPMGRPDWLWAAADLMDIDRDAAGPAEIADLIDAGPGVRFHHPLIRAAIYRIASSSERGRAHDALARAITGPNTEEHRAWHRAHAATGPDEQVATELEHCAERVRARGGVAGAAAFLAHAADLTPDPGRRARRALDAAQAKLDAGAPDAASHLLTIARDASEDDMVDARTDLIRARLAFAASRGKDAPPLLLAAAQRMSRLDAPLSREIYLDALMAAMLVGRFAADHRATASAVAEVARTAPAAAEPPGALDLLLDGVAQRLVHGQVEAASLLRRAVDGYLRENEQGAADPRWHEITHRVCLDLFDQRAYNVLVGSQLAALRQAGALTLLPVALVTEAGLRVTGGDFARAAALLEEAEGIVAATTGVAQLQTTIHCYLAAYRGQETRCRELVEAGIAEATTRGAGFEVATTLYASAILHNGLSQYHEAFRAAATALRYDDLGISNYLLVELVEAASHCGEMTAAADALRELSARTQVSPTETARGVWARSAALLTDGPEAEKLFQSALTDLAESPAVVYLPRTHLLYGEWLRRMKRRSEAREQLHLAHDMFVEMGAEGFAHRARRELRATGEAVHNRAPRAAVDLTSQESQIAALARDGRTNSEIAALLFISPRTVEWHLGRVFAKLGISSRRALRTMTFENTFESA